MPCHWSYAAYQINSLRLLGKRCRFYSTLGSKRWRVTIENEDYQKNYLVPFRVAYAMSIHKAQGLEYASAKIIISDAVEPLITPNIFYTAITRTTAKLQIYSTAKALKPICERMENEFGDKHDYKEFMHLHQDLEKKRRNICERIPK